MAITKTNRFTTIELIRFLGACSIMFYHFEPLYLQAKTHHVVPFAYIFVEFFFILSGFFMIKHIEEKKDPSTPFYYVWHKLKSFYPIYIVALLCQFILNVLTTPLNTVTAIGKALLHFKWEFLLLQTAAFIPDPAFGKDYLLGPAWYLSALLIALLIAYPLALYAQKIYRYLICPMAVLLIYGFIMQTVGCLDMGNEYFAFILSANLRGLAGICAGSLCYYGYAFLQKSQLVTARKNVFLALEALCYLFFCTLFIGKGLWVEADILFFVPVFAGIVILATINQTPISRFFNTQATKTLAYLGRLSLYLYLLHWPVITALKYVSPQLPQPTATLLFFSITILFAMLLQRTLEGKDKINTTRLTGGMFTPIRGCYRPAPKDAGFHIRSSHYALATFATP